MARATSDKILRRLTRGQRPFEQPLRKRLPANVLHGEEGRSSASPTSYTVVDSRMFQPRSGLGFRTKPFAIDRGGELPAKYRIFTAASRPSD